MELIALRKWAKCLSDSSLYPMRHIYNNKARPDLGSVIVTPHTLASPSRTDTHPSPVCVVGRVIAHSLADTKLKVLLSQLSLAVSRTTVGQAIFLWELGKITLCVLKSQYTLD